MEKISSDKTWIWYKSIKFQVSIILLVQFAALLSIVLTSLYLVNLRQHDYIILNLTGQLRVLDHGMVTQARNYAQQSARQNIAFGPDPELFKMDLLMHVEAYNRIISSLKARSIEADLVHPRALAKFDSITEKVPSLTDNPEPIICNWDAPSRNQMDATAAVWDGFHKGLSDRLGDASKSFQLVSAANYIVDNSQDLTTSTTRLASTFRAMMERKLAQIQLLNNIGIGIIIMISLTIIFIVYRRIFRPIDQTVAGFQRVARGELTHRVPIQVRNEIGAMTASFNDLTGRLSSLFQLADQINQTDNVDDTLRYVFECFPVFFPINWVGLLRSSRNNREYHIDRSYCSNSYDLNENEHFEMTGSLFHDTAQHRRPFCNITGDARQFDWRADAFVQRLQQNHLQSIFYLPISGNALETAVLVLAAEPANAYNDDHLEFLTNIAGQVARSFEKTIGMESLVITSIKGLANLAESRDPETGEHLFRMSHYSALIAEELGKLDRYQPLINQHYIRDVLRFAPMHDIGKVGIADEILLKPGKLDEQQTEAMRLHTVIGANVLRRCEEQMNAVGRSIFKIGIEIAECHHERYDGTGYPNQLEAEAIPLSARIVAAADVFDALTSKRPYKEAWPFDQAIAYLKEESGRHFDPEVVDACLRAMPKIRQIYDKHKHV